MREIRPRQITSANVTVPGSKSYTHRMLIAAALSEGRCVIRNPLRSEDTDLTLSALIQLGIAIEENHDALIVHGRRGRLTIPEKSIYLANSGTSMRLLTAMVALGAGKCRLEGSRRMHQRPIHDLLDGLQQLDVNAQSIYRNGYPPVEVIGKRIKGGKIDLNCATSSQFLSALLIIAPYTLNGVEITVIEGPVSRPYVDITLDTMQQFGVPVQRRSYNWFKVKGSRTYCAGSYHVEPDCSQASYFWAVAAVIGTAVKVMGISANSPQGDIRILKLLEAMGCRVCAEPDGITVIGRELSGIETDMADTPDVVPTLAVVAAFAKGKTVIKNVAHLSAKESNRLNAVVTNLRKMGIDADCSDTRIVIRGGLPRGTDIETFGDHRIAMSYAVAGLKIPGVSIKDEYCVTKSFPNFWNVFESLY